MDLIISLISRKFIQFLQNMFIVCFLWCWFCSEKKQQLFSQIFPKFQLKPIFMNSRTFSSQILKKRVGIEKLNLISILYNNIIKKIQKKKQLYQMRSKLGQDVINHYKPYANTKSQWKNINISNKKFEVYKQYEIVERIGEGAYGTVVSAFDTKVKDEKSKFLAIKKIEKAFEHRIFAKRTLRELKQLRLLQHQNIMDIKTIICPKSRQQFEDIYLVSQLMDSDLSKVLKSSQQLTEEHYKFFLYQIFRGLKYIHSAKIVHRDLKPRNLLVNSNCDLKICDFGLARFLNSQKYSNDLTDYVCTRWYRAPQLLVGENDYTTAVDMWSVGCIMAQLFERTAFLKGNNTKHQIQLILDSIDIPNVEKINFIGEEFKLLIKKYYKPKKITKLEQKFSYLSPPALDLLKKLLAFDPKQRITAEEALKHPYLSQLHLQQDEPTSQEINPLQFQFQKYSLTTQQLKDLLYQQILLYNNQNFRKEYEKKLKNKESIITYVLNNSNKQNLSPQSEEDD